MIRDNLSRLQDFVKSARLSCIIIPGIDSTIPDIYYYTGLEDRCLSFLIVTKNDTILYCWDHDKARKDSNVKKVISIYDMKLSDVIKNIEADKGRIGISFETPHKIIKNLKDKLPKADFIDISESLSKLRSIKKEYEIDKIRQACRVTDSLFKYIRSENIKNFNEKQIAFDITELAARKGYHLTTNIVIAGDASSAEMHHIPQLKKFKENLLIDIGVINGGYRSDAARTFVVGEDRKIMDAKNALLRIHDALDDYIEEGMIISELCNFTKDRLKAEGYDSSGYFNFHALGHGVGLEDHETPHISHGNNSILEKNMIIAIEPGIYFPSKFGVRLEDTILIKKKGIERLTKFPLNLN